MPTVISICGGSSTGKTSQIAPYLYDRLPGPSIILHQDPFRSLTSHRTFELVADDPGAYEPNFGLRVIQAFKKRESIVVPIWHLNYTDNERKKMLGEKSLLPVETLIFEGIYSSYGPLSKAAHFSIYVEAPLWTRYIRGILRNWLERKTSQPGSISKSFLHYVLPAHQKYVVLQKKEADLIISLPYDFTHSIQKFSLVPLLSQFPQTQLIIKIELDVYTHLQLVESVSTYIVQLIYRERLYIEFPINESDREVFLSVDWHSL